MTPPKQGGFTLIEMVVAIAVLAMVGGAGAAFVKPAVDAWVATRARAALTAEAGTATRYMSGEVRAAVPNSIRTPNASCFEVIPSTTGGAYRSGPDTVNDSSASCTPSSTCSAPFATDRSLSSVDILGIMSKAPVVGDLVFIATQNTSDVYSGASRAAITSVATPRATDGRYRIGFAAKAFPQGYSGGRLYIASAANQAVSYFCSGADETLDANGDGKGVLYRKAAYGFVASPPAACPSIAGAEVVARNVRSCAFTYAPGGATQQNGLLVISLTVARSNESITLVDSIHVDNAP